MNLVKKISSEKGASLVEIVASVAILGILTVAFFNVFTSSYKSVSDTGNKSAATKKASDILELLYTYEKLSDSDTLIDAFLSSNIQDGTAIEMVADDSPLLFQYPGANTVRLNRKTAAPLPGGDGFIVTVVVFYNSGADYVALSSFYKGGPDI